MKEALLYKRIDGGKVECGLCNHRCKISPGKRGLCSVRENRDGTLYSLVYGKIIAKNIDPIEKKTVIQFSSWVTIIFYRNGRLQHPVPALPEL